MMHFVFRNDINVPKCCSQTQSYRLPMYIDSALQWRIIVHLENTVCCKFIQYLHLNDVHLMYMINTTQIFCKFINLTPLIWLQNIVGGNSYRGYADLHWQKVTGIKSKTSNAIPHSISWSFNGLHIIRFIASKYNYWSFVQQNIMFSQVSESINTSAENNFCAKVTVVCS